MTQISIEDIKLQPLRIPMGWEVSYNRFYDVYPEQANDLIPKYFTQLVFWDFFNVTLLQAVYKHTKILIDLGWYPEHDPEGEFGITVLRKNDNREHAFDNWEHPLYEFSSRNKDEIVDKLNELMADVAAGKIK